MGGDASGPNSVAEWQNTTIGYLAQPWITSPFDNANWLGIFDSTGEYYFRLKFNLDPSVVVSNFTLPMTFAVDDVVTEVYVNGIAQSTRGIQLPIGGFTELNDLNLENDWQLGLNELIFRVGNIQRPSGLLIQMHPTLGMCREANLVVEKQADRATAMPNETVTYTISVTNTSTLAAENISVTDIVPSNALDQIQWSCSATGNATCPALTGQGNITHTGINLPAGDSLNYVLTGRVLATAPDPFINTAVIDPGTGTCTANAEQECSSSAEVGKQRIIDPNAVKPVPSLQEWALITLTLLLAVFGIYRMRKQLH